MATEIVLTNDCVLQFLDRFEEIAAKEDFDLIEDMVHDHAFLRFNDGDFKGKAAVRGAFEKTWKGSANVRKERFYLTDIEALNVDLTGARPADCFPVSLPAARHCWPAVRPPA